MLTNSTQKATVFSVITLFLILSTFSPLLLRPQGCAAAQPCPDVGTLELKYDDGIPYEQLSSLVAVCTSCTHFQGVLFSLPEGVASSILTKVRFYAGGGKAPVHVWLYDTQLNRLTDPIEYLVSEERWHEILLPDVVVPSKFWVLMERSNEKVMPFYDIRPGNPSHSYYFNKVTDAAVQSPAGDFMIRATIVPEVHVGDKQAYKGIQEAIDAVSDGWIVVVHEGTYNENVTVNKSVTIKSLSGPVKTIVQTSPPYSDNNVFRITASCVKLSGFTIQGAAYAGRAGVRLEDASGCVISGNVILDNNYGIYVSEGSTSNILLENECELNENGIYIDGSENYASGNKLHGNTASVGSAADLSAIGSGNQLRFNTITVDPGTDPAVANGPQVYNQNGNEQISGVENWWGTDTGPSNARGQGPAVGDRVLFDPWLTKQPLRVNTVAASGGGFTMDAKGVTSTVVLKEGAGTPIVSTARFGENPFGTFPGKPIGEWVDVLFSSNAGINQVEIRQYYTADEIAGLKEGSLRLFWWNGEKWKVCSKTSVDQKNDFVWTMLNGKTKPKLDNLNGTMFAVGVPKGGFAWWLIPLIIVIGIVALIAIRLFWVLVIKRERYTVD